MTANPLRFLRDWLLWPLHRTPTEVDNAELRAENGALKVRLQAEGKQTASLERRIERLRDEVRGLKVDLADAQSKAEASQMEVENMQASLTNMRAQYKADTAIAARREAFGVRNPPSTTRRTRQ